MTDTMIAGTQPSQPLGLRDERGGVVAGDWQRWLGRAASEDERLLDRAIGPVLDIGCGPGRHVLALARRGVACLGIDVTPSAVRLARSRGAIVVECSIFGAVRGGRMWATALLLDGNIGIGGDPVALLARVASVLQAVGRILVKLGAPGTGGGSGRARGRAQRCHRAVVWLERGGRCLYRRGGLTSRNGPDECVVRWWPLVRPGGHTRLLTPVTQIDEVRASAHTIPTQPTRPDGTLEWDATTVIVAEVVAGGVWGLGYSFGEAAAAGLVRRMLAPKVVGLHAMAIPAAWTAVVRAARNVGRGGIATGAIDAALVARAADPMVRRAGKVS